MADPVRCRACLKPFGSAASLRQHAEAKGHAQDGSAEVRPWKVGEPEPPCPYCMETAVFWPSSALLYNGRDYGPVWICEPCQTWCGCHPGTFKPLGRLADKELRLAKQAAHAAFDRLWQAKARRGCRRKVARGLAYRWLAGQLGIDPLYCHIGMMDVERCQQVVALCAPYLREIGRAA